MIISSLLRNPALAGFIFLAACTPTSSRLAAKPVYKVNEHSLLVKDFSVRLAKQLKNQNSLVAKEPSIIEAAKASVIRDFTIDSLTLDWAKENNIQIADPALEVEIQEQKKIFRDDATFRKQLADENISYVQWKEQIKLRLIEKELFSRLKPNATAIEDIEVKNYYENNKERFQRKERIQISQIIVDDQIKAETVRDLLKKESFEKVAKEYSRSSDSPVSGWIEKGSVDFLDPLFAQKGASPSIVQSHAGFHVVRVEKRLAAGFLSLDEARPTILGQIGAQREQSLFSAWLDGRLKKSRIMKDSELLNSIRVETKSNRE